MLCRLPYFFPICHFGPGGGGECLRRGGAGMVYGPEAAVQGRIE